MKIQLIRVHEDGTCAKWSTDPGDLNILFVIPTRPERPAHVPDAETADALRGLFGGE